MTWMLAYKHNFSPKRYYNWNNKDIVYKNKSLYFDYWFDINIIVVSQLLNNDGVVLTYKDFLNTFKLLELRNLQLSWMQSLKKI